MAIAVFTVMPCIDDPASMRLFSPGEDACGAVLVVLSSHVLNINSSRTA